jgi:hypothetical protein
VTAIAATRAGGPPREKSPLLATTSYNAIPASTVPKGRLVRDLKKENELFLKQCAEFDGESISSFENSASEAPSEVASEGIQEEEEEESDEEYEEESDDSRNVGRKAKRGGGFRGGVPKKRR